MTYTAGIDLGTTFTAAAVVIDGHGEMVNLSSQHPTVASIVWLGSDGTWLVGEPARRRGMTEPDRVAREFKRRLGDPAPVVLGGTPVATQMLMAELLEWTVGVVTERNGGPPDAITITHPANWGDYRRSLLEQVVDRSDLPSAALLTEPEAAAIDYATRNRVADGATVAVYDLGGGTFDAAVVRRSGDDFHIIGPPVGIESLGGIDFDAAVFDFVADQVGGFGDLDPENPNVASQIDRLRSECSEAKIALSATTETVIPVMVSGRSEHVRLTRSEFEERVRPLLDATIESLRSALHRAEIIPSQLDSVLLVGGSSRIPLIGQLVTSELGRPVAVDSDPKHGIARGAAHHAARRVAEDQDRSAAAARIAAPIPAPPAAPPRVAPPPAPAAPIHPPPAAMSSAPSEPASAPAPAAPPAHPPPVAPTAHSTAPPTDDEPPVIELTDRARTPNRLPVLVGGIVAAVLLVIVGVTLLGGGDEPIVEPAAPTDPTEPAAEVGFSAREAEAALTSQFGVDTVNPDYDVSDCDEGIEIPTEVRVPFDFTPATGVYIFSSDDAAKTYLANELAKDGRTCRLPELDRRFSLEVQSIDADTVDKLSTEEGSTVSTHIRMERTGNAVVFAVETTPGEDLAAVTNGVVAALGT